ncbi:MAG: class I SAM-dependent rRNA methyltransferase [Clostridia bacterium]|nr:class I SAM-dependent rRNA methyltransferase [Clostridia bacterium]
MDRPFSKIICNEKAAKLLRAGHPWVYGEETRLAGDPPENGAIVDVYTEKGRWMGAGFYNAHSKILVRLLSRNTNDRFDEAFWRRRIEYAVAYRRTVMGEAGFRCCRLIFGEADLFPGLTVDRFEDVLVTEVLSLGIEVRKELLYSLLREVLAEAGVPVRCIYERNESPLREKEGMQVGKGCAFGDPGDGHVQIVENGLRYDVDFVNGQKTGFFLDQKYNRAAAARLAKGRSVLDCFTHTGAFGMNCAAGGARQVISVDISEDACVQTRANLALNGLEGNVSVCQADVFDLLTRLAAGERPAGFPSGRHPFDYIILDPPAFTKSRQTAQAAFRGYKEINLKAMKLLPRGGYLATCSCSHFMESWLFEKMLREAASDAGVQLRQIENRQQSPDHPILWGVPETEYLKFYLFQIV